MIVTTLKRCGIAFLCVLAVLALVAVSSYGSFTQRKQTLADLKQAAEERGLYCVEIALGTMMEGMVVSTERRSPEEIKAIRFVNMRDPVWIGRIYAESLSKTAAISSPPPQAIWGGLQLYGDPELIRYLTSR